VEEASSKPLGLNAASSGSIGAQSVGAVARGDVELGAETAAVARPNAADGVAAHLCASPARLSRRVPLRLDESKNAAGGIR
jgi:hypothetical protein